MASFTNSPSRQKLLKAVKDHFESNGWFVETVRNDYQDYSVSIGKIKFAVLCVDENRGNFHDSTNILTKIERASVTIRGHWNRVLITVLDRNFLNVPLDDLRSKRVFVTTMPQLDEVSALGIYAQSEPGQMTPLQEDLLTSELQYGIFVSDRYQKKGDQDRAITWAQHATAAGTGITDAHLHLFSLYRKYQKLEEADKISKIITDRFGDNPKFIKMMVSYSKERGDTIAAVTWENKLSGSNLIPRNIQDILTIQRSRQADSPAENITPKRPELNAPSHKSGLLARIVTSLKSRH
ncbi:tetratricopeptide repeat protein [Acidisoma silvae]|uniref:Uncharacterized protein n=1 Tax=Acidisoma silvae TaxID=2802396 RepID=A0A963YMP9_9PROT|nr:hypothetical protein [Acidisoma silvae]MCB8873626.1 hypothetical protein [Acidisoma silvae]